MEYLLLLLALITVLWTAFGWKATALIAFFFATLGVAGWYMDSHEGKEFHVLWLIPIFAGVIAYSILWGWLMVAALS